ncbi:MAG: Sfum_1244 family protein [Thiobacillaceae bacterium]
MQNFHETIETIQRNCHIADANHAREMTMCNYLLGMREYYRWENELPLTQQPPKHEIGEWLTAREALWDSLERDNFEPVPVDNRHYDPFAIDAINQAIQDHGLVYGAGIGRFRQPHFFLGELIRKEEREGLTIYVTGCEYARDITSFPAAYQEGAIILRMDALKRVLWEKVEMWGLKQQEGALKSALDCYGFDRNPDRALNHMAEMESETVILHEVGEARAGRELGLEWRSMIASFNGKRAEVFARAIKDNLADCLSTLPALMDMQAKCSLHFYFAEFDGLRKSLFPALAEGYHVWRETGNDQSLREAVKSGQQHWLKTAQQLVATYARDPQNAEKNILAQIPADLGHTLCTL